MVLHNAYEGQRGTRLIISTKGRDAIHKGEVILPVFVKEKTSKKLVSTDLTKCFLPNTESLNQLPFSIEPYQMPTNVDEILRRDAIDDDVLELCMQETLIKGNILTNFEDSNSAVCVPKQIIDELYCPTHDTIKPQWH